MTGPLPEPGIPDEASEAAAFAIFGGSQDVWDRNPGNLQRDYRAPASRALAAAVPLLYAAWETDLRERIASEIGARSIGAESVARGQTFAMNEFDRGIGVAAAVARGVGAETRKDQDA